MSIEIKNNQFHLRTKTSSYIFCVLSDRYLVHLYWGEKFENDVDLKYNADEYYRWRCGTYPFYDENSTNLYTTYDLRHEFSVVGGGDFRIPTFDAKYKNGSTVSEFEFESYKVYDGKPKLCSLPATYDEGGDAETLEVVLCDKLTGLKATLVYSVFEEYDVITRSIRYDNCGNDSILLKSCQSASVDFIGTDYKLLNLQGEWCNERSVEWQKVGHSIINIDSKTGMSSHARNPFLVLADENTDEYSGNAYGMALVYSGSFSMTAEGTSFGYTRIAAGINPYDFEWDLDKGESFQTPEVVMAFSNTGLNDMSRRYHKIFRERLCRGKFRDMPRPMLVNNWEATGADFTEDKIVDIAKAAAKVGFEMVVLDDGWFGKRDNDLTSLGDWYVHKTKLPKGLASLVNRVNEMGLKFGLWFEPEMISADSDLYRAHPDWCIHCDGRRRTEGRHQLMLDLSRDEVCDYIIKVVSDILESANIEYVKWDCNRNITETQNNSQKHKFMLGTYKVMEALVTKFPDVLFESCASGGGRFDAGMLYYMPQTWTSDCTEAVTRMHIQYGTSFAYPVSSMAAHVGKMAVGFDKFNGPMDTSAKVAMGANFGFEMDLSELSETETEQVKGYVEQYKLVRETVQFGELYRLESPFETPYASWMMVKDNQAVLFAHKTSTRNTVEKRQLKLKGLDKNKQYRCNDKIYDGETLMKLGFVIPQDSKGHMYVFETI